LQVLGEADVSVKGMLEEFGVYLKPAAFKQDVKPLLKDSCSAVFGSATGLTDMLVQHMPLSRVGTATKVCSLWTSARAATAHAGAHAQALHCSAT
jgi:116 kDa U5 small nuclear ribonucleoprotein component